MAFKFPPPPPPPPKAASNDSQQTYTSQRGGPGRGRGDRGRGRGGSGRGGQGQGGEGRSNAHSGRGGSRGGYNSTRGGAPQQQHRAFPPSQTNALPNGSHVAYINPAFAAQPQVGGQAQQHMDPNAFAQAVSFMSTPVGIQTMAAFANNVPSPAFGVPQYPQSPPSQNAQAAPRYSPNQQAGQKRKRPEQNRTTQPPLPPKKPQQSGPKPPRAKAAPPPPVPSFGFSLPQPSSTQQPTHTQQNNKKGNTKRKVNLGLTQQHMQDDSSSSEEEEVDEEAAFALNAKVEGVAFEHNGETISLQTPADIQSFIKDRRRNFPTQQRAAEKAAEAARKREAELEFLYRVTGKVRKPKDVARQERPPKISKKSREVDQGKQKELAALRKRLHESMVNKQGAPRTVDLGLGYASETDSDGGSSVLSESSVVSSSEESSEESDSGSEDGDSDAPEAQSSKVGPPTINVPPPVPQAQPTRVCHLWGQNGKCRFGASCRYAHPPDRKGKAKDAEKRMGLYEKLVEQELEKSDRLALDAIKYLGQHGFLG